MAATYLDFQIFIYKYLSQKLELKNAIISALSKNEQRILFLFQIYCLFVLSCMKMTVFLLAVFFQWIS